MYKSTQATSWRCSSCFFDLLIETFISAACWVGWIMWHQLWPQTDRLQVLGQKHFQKCYFGVIIMIMILRMRERCGRWTLRRMSRRWREGRGWRRSWTARYQLWRRWWNQEKANLSTLTGRRKEVSQCLAVWTALTHFDDNCDDVLCVQTSLIHYTSSQ